MLDKNLQKGFSSLVALLAMKKYSEIDFIYHGMSKE